MNKQEFIDELRPALVELESMRKTQLNLINKGYMYYGIAVFFAFAGIFLTIFGKIYALVCFFIAVLALRIRPLDIGDPAGKYRTFYKHKIIAAFVKKLGPTIVFKSNRFVFQQILERSGLFGVVGLVEGEDHFEGNTKNGYPFQFSEVLVYSNGIKHVDVSQGIPFDGLLFIIKSPEELVEHLLILPKSFSKKGQLKVPTSMKDNVTLNLVNIRGRNSDFEKGYMVYSKNAEDGRHLLTLELLKIVQELSKTWRMPLRMAFVKDKIYLALPSATNYFEQSVTRSVTNRAIVQNIYNELTKNLNVVEKISEVLAQVSIPDPTTKIEIKDEKIAPKNNWNNTAYDHFIDDGF